MEAAELNRRVTALQACVRGRLVRRRLRSVRDDYEAAVRDIEGHVGLLQWRGRWIPRPLFLREKTKAKPVRAPEVVPQSGVESCPGGGQDQPRAPLDEEPERDCADRSHGETPAQLPGEKRSPNRGGVRGPEPGDPSRWERSWSGVPEEPGSETNRSDASSMWSSGIWETEAADPRAGGDRGSHPGSQLPSGLPQLQRHRSHLAMELLWLQQAIASRKEYLLLKQKLGPPEG
ncbi:IQ domain-containing protein C [Ornithorhynchus anatinus]|uniref:IQ domain-containing protein C n=1 Tax=Ornithorhynchus anatinus TaxID=9258 RepID=UPI0010A83C12|nr:IQ domain-containing protein C [Ornithorhynchus anatinus]